MAIQIIDGEAVHRALDYPGLIDALERYHHEPPPQMDRSWLEAEPGSASSDGFLVLPALQPGEMLGAKLVTVFAGNLTRAEGMPSVQALYTLFDARNGAPLAVIDGTAMTYRKTAADSALGARFLARDDARHMLMIGAGGMAPHLIEAHLAVRPGIERVTIWNRTAERAVALCTKLGNLEVALEAATDLERAVRAADVISCATLSRAPLIFADWLQPGTHIDLVGAFTTDMVEADAGVAAIAEVHVDSRWFTIGHCGDLDRPLDQDLIDESDIRGDLYELCQGKAKGRSGPYAITMFKNGGGAHLDLMTARFLWERTSAGR
jgi:alanine dehydrogenase